MTQAQKRKLVNAFGAILRAAVLIGIAYVIIQPMLTRLSTSFMAVEELYDQSVKWIPRNPTLINYQRCWVHEIPAGTPEYLYSFDCCQSTAGSFMYLYWLWIS